MQLRLFLCWLFVITIPGFARAEETLPYEPKSVTLQGTLSLEAFPGRPNYESVARGDEIERAWILSLDQPISAVATLNDELNETHNHVQRVQIICRENCEDFFPLNTGKRVEVHGTLSSAITGHHHTDVLITVASER